MSKHKKFNYIVTYLRTIIITIIVAFVLVLALVAYIEHQVDEGQRQLAKKEKDDDSSIQLLIIKNQYLENINPKDYSINLKLGILFEAEKKYKAAESEYLKAIAKVPFGEYKPQYRLALLYIQLNRLDEAQALMDDVGEHPDKKLIKYKAEVYEKLGDAYFNQSYYDDASFKYQKALFYYSAINSKHRHKVEGDLASSYIYLADNMVKEYKVDEAISYLQMAKALIDSPLIQYKLAVLLTNSNPGQAYQYYDDVFKKAPEIINFTAYNNFLNKLAQQAEDIGEFAQADLYDYKIKKLKEYFKEKILCFDDLAIIQPRGFFALNFWRNKYHLNFECKFKNTSKIDVDSLYIELVFRTKYKELYTYKQQIFDANSTLPAGKISPLIGINSYFKIPKDDEIVNDMTVQVYVSKLEDSSKIFLTEIPIKRRVHKKLVFRIFHLKFVFP